MNYEISNCQVRSYEEGVIITVCDKNKHMLGDIHCTPRKKVDKIDLLHIVKSLLKVNEDFNTLMSRAIEQLKPYVETIDIKLVF